MKIYTCCKYCGQNIRIEGSSATRWELSEKRGKEFRLKCSYCRRESIYSVDNVKAKGGVIDVVLSLVLFLFGFLLFLYLCQYATKGIITIYLLPIGVMVPVLVSHTFFRIQRQNVNRFNSSSINSLNSRKIHRKL